MQRGNWRIAARHRAPRGAAISGTEQALGARGECESSVRGGKGQRERHEAARQPALEPEPTSPGVEGLEERGAASAGSRGHLRRGNEHAGIRRVGEEAPYLHPAHARWLPRCSRRTGMRRGEGSACACCQQYAPLHVGNANTKRRSLTLVFVGPVSNKSPVAWRNG